MATSKWTQDGDTHKEWPKDINKVKIQAKDFAWYGSPGGGLKLVLIYKSGIRKTDKGQEYGSVSGFIADRYDKWTLMNDGLQGSINYSDLIIVERSSVPEAGVKLLEALAEEYAWNHK